MLWGSAVPPPQTVARSVPNCLDLSERLKVTSDSSY
jgi:hypothetical protein